MGDEMNFLLYAFSFLFPAGGIFLFLTWSNMKADLISMCGENNMLRGRIISLTVEIQQTRAYSNELFLKRNMNVALNPTMVKRLIGLCHPDKHNNSRAATEVTQWLLAQR